MAARGNLDDVQIKVKIDTSESEASVKKLGDSFNQFAKDAGKRLGQAGFGILAGTAAGLSAQAGADLFQSGRALTNVVGRQFSRSIGLRGFATGLRGDEAAVQRTVQAFGLAGEGAVKNTPGAVEGVFKAFQRIEGLRERSRTEVEDLLNVQVGGVGEKLVGIMTDIRGAIYTVRDTIKNLGGRFR